MSMSRRWAGALLFSVLLFAGCEKSGTTGSSAPGKAGDDSYGKKLVGVWEGTEDFGGKAETVTVEFKADNSLKIAMGPFNLLGTWKITKEEAKTLTVETDAKLEGFPEEKGKEKSDKKNFKIVFQDANTIVMSEIGPKPEEKTLKRKS